MCVRFISHHNTRDATSDALACRTLRPQNAKTCGMYADKSQSHGMCADRTTTNGNSLLVVQTLDSQQRFSNVHQALGGRCCLSGTLHRNVLWKLAS